MFTKLFDEQERRESECGSVLLFAALVLIAICGMIAIAVDGARLMDAHTEKKATADHVALVALERYLSADVDPAVFPTNGERHAERFRQAVDSAVKVGGWNYLTARFGEQHIQNKNQLWKGIDAGDADRGSIKSGRWWMERPACNGAHPACPCDTATPLPCFQECSDGPGACAPVNAVMSQVLPGDADPRLYANAVRVSLHTGPNDSDKMTNYFASVLGIMFSSTGATSTAANSATSAVLPKSTVILFDLSRSTTVENFLPWEKVPPGTPYRREYSYRLNTGVCPVTGPVANYAIQGPVSAAPGANPTVVGLKAALPSAAGPGSTSPWKQAWRENPEQARYQCVQAWTANGLAAQRYLVYTEPSVDPAVAVRPEPLYSMFDAAADVLRNIQKTASPADKVGVVFFDHQENIAPRVFELKTVIDPQFSLLQQIFDTSLPHTPANPAWNRRMEYGIFPRTASSMYAGSDPTRAFGQAFAMFQRGSNLFYADNAVLLMTNGLANCAMDSSVNARVCRGYMRANSIDRDPDGSGTYFNPAVVPMSTWGGAWTNAETAAPTRTEWNDVYRLHKYSLSASIAGSNSVNFEKNKIRLHVALAGRHVSPHTVLLKSIDTPPTGCMVDNEIRRRNLLTVLPSPNYNTIDDLMTNSVGWVTGDPPVTDDMEDAYENHRDVKMRYMKIGYTPRLGAIPSPDDYADSKDAGFPYAANDEDADYLQPNYYYYSAVRALQGAWIPVRKSRCVAGTEAVLDALCHTGPTPPSVLIGASSALQTDDFNYRPAAGFGDPLVRPVSPLTPPTLDTSGRLLCDPAQLTIDASPQTVYPGVYNGVGEIQSERPIVLVHE